MGVMGTRRGAGAGNVVAAGFAIGCLISALVSAMISTGPAAAQSPAQSCSKPEFESVVETAAATLRDLNARNKPGFQDKLRLLKDRRGWSTEQFLAEAAVYVQDERIADLDTRSSELLSRLNTMGEAGASAKTPDCKLLAELRATMKSLVDTQIEKWTYMFGKLERALAP